ncbi:MAG TPA: glycosyltransferase [Pyrinomonadaceae bacterium]|nr:glycosyltransferase [Pyrinomonadaceae bacterium]
MKVLHVSPSFHPAGHYGGPIYSGYRLCNSEVELPNIELKVLTTDSDGPKRIRVDEIPTRLPEGYDVFYCRRWLQPDLAPEMLLRLPSLIRWSDVVHLTSVYSASTIPTLLFCRLYRKPVVWSTRGALQRWEGSTRTTIKRIWERLCNSLCNPERVVLHVTSEAERLDSVKRIPNALAVVIPNGIELSESWVQLPRKHAELRILYLGRLHPIKGIENLLRAFPLLKTEARLSICGEGDLAYQKQLQSLAHELGLNGRVKFHGRVGGEAKEQQFEESDLCVVPSFKENFCIVVAEALARGVPVVASRGTPWQRLVEMGCGLWVDNTSEELAKAIDSAASLPLKEMGQRGRAWMGEEYSWQTIAERMVGQYGSLIEASASGQSRIAVA